MCKNKKIQDLCKWNAGDQFFILSQDLFCFLESDLGQKEDNKCWVWVENYEKRFEVSKKDLLWIPTLTQLVLTIKEQFVIERMSLNFLDGKWTFNAHCTSIDSYKNMPVIATGESAHEACLKALTKIIKSNEKIK